MQTHNLKRAHPNKKTRLIGRGGTRGKTSGRGTKGQNARAGHKKRPEIRDFIKRVPKLRGRGKNVNTSIELKPLVVNVGSLNKAFKNGDTVSPRTLVKKGVVKTLSGNLPRVKILGTGVLDKSIKVKECAVSKSAIAMIEKAGGSVIV
ncbi:MAG: 50S ribosomal protein L15 [Candidatus Zambryskibacteria bacterium RIFOXYD1_FULL_40_13]|nr:MAG: 50S ribosomal protein L15 [Parcubacteria group bacterium GW2011_GWC1_39_12]KKR19367.1 MAG: 50S ribosomal protein L15 [Parcubacteria group bacterium GW2011_GWF1_39_37]KKR35251.1 MAG: 50S ribosomal protein L15 [Parcubacteria group bacterium GW2011_GWC2_40_10]KKR52316.1 MAG: 50S ribosomal protein L15 [Parcubacteria group bacterium GW2011_GWE1_40_20]KKR65829.1 MAG: 50S ribosomal protein L15 [Parcubacteria group bacterium GW2011_GWB1_40_5]KKR69360.1 MAG: 50S ribosomal protein L15 [Parcubact